MHRTVNAASMLVRIQPCQPYYVIMAVLIDLRYTGYNMPICKKCSQHFSTRIRIEGKLHVLSNRKYCLDCSPFKQHNTKQLHIDNQVKLDNKRKKNSEFVINRRKKLSAMALEYKGGKCQICGYNKCSTALEFHHIDPSKKKFGVKSGNTHSWDILKIEVDKCILLCSNCHREVEAGITKIPAINI